MNILHVFLINFISTYLFRIVNISLINRVIRANSTDVGNTANKINVFVFAENNNESQNRLEFREKEFFEKEFLENEDTNKRRYVAHVEENINPGEKTETSGIAETTNVSEVATKVDVVTEKETEELKESVDINPPENAAEIKGDTDIDVEAQPTKNLVENVKDTEIEITKENDSKDINFIEEGEINKEIKKKNVPNNMESENKLFEKKVMPKKKLDESVLPKKKKITAEKKEKVVKNEHENIILKKPEFIKHLFDTLSEIFLIVKIGALYRYEHFFIPLKNKIITNFLNQLHFFFLTVVSVHKTSSEKYGDIYALFLLVLLFLGGKFLLKKVFCRKSKIYNESSKNKQNDNVYIENLLKRILFNLEKNKDMTHYQNTLNEILENTENIIVNINIINKENKNIYTDIISNINNIGVYTYISTQALKKINRKSDVIINELISNKLLINDENDSTNLSDINEINDIKKNLLIEYTDLPDFNNNNLSNINNINNLKNNLLNAYDENDANNLKGGLVNEYDGETFNQLKGNVRNEVNMNINERRAPDFVKKKITPNEQVTDAGLKRNINTYAVSNTQGLIVNSGNVNTNNNSGIISGITSGINNSRNVPNNNTAPISNETIIINNKSVLNSRNSIDEMNEINQHITSIKNTSVDMSSKGNVYNELNGPLVHSLSNYVDNANYPKCVNSMGNTSSIENTSNTVIVNNITHRGTKGVGMINANHFIEKDENKKGLSESITNINNQVVSKFSDEKCFGEIDINMNGKKDFSKQISVTNNETILKKHRNSLFFEESDEREKDKDLLKGGVIHPLPPININRNYRGSINNVNDRNNFSPGHNIGSIATGNTDINNFEKDKGIESGIEERVNKENAKNKNMIGTLQRKFSSADKDPEESIKHYTQGDVTRNVDSFEKWNEIDLKSGPTTMNNYLNKNDEMMSEEIPMLSNSSRPGISYHDTVKSPSKTRVSDLYITSSPSTQNLETNFNRNQKYITQRKERQKIVATKSPFN